MFSAGDIIKHGLPGFIGFLLGLVAIAVIQPVTTDGKVLLLATTICLTIVVYMIGRWLIGFFGAGRGGKQDQADGEG
jgi:phosphotransferase system  glucose/maltose/N-acetylglucosamine-specific IIC component